MNLNEKDLACISLNTVVDHPRMKGAGYYVGYDGKGRICMGTGGVTYSHQIGDPCMGIQGDHVEPGVSMASKNEGENAAIQALSCVGNPVEIISGPLAGAKGIVTGTHGGVDHTMAWFEPEVIEKMNGTESFLIKARGQGLKVEELPDVTFMSIDPDLLKLIPAKAEDGVLTFPVAAVVPSFLMGSGLGVSTVMSGDYDIMTMDKEANKKFGIDNLKFGDFVAIVDHDSNYGPHYRSGAMTLGVIVHSDSFTSGHGPGVCVIATSTDGKIEPVISPFGNIACYAEQLIKR